MNNALLDFKFYISATRQKIERFFPTSNKIIILKDFKTHIKKVLIFKIYETFSKQNEFLFILYHKIDTTTSRILCSFMRNVVRRNTY